MRLRHALWGSLLLLAACGGGGSVGGSSAPVVAPAPVPPTAHSFADYFPFLNGQSGTGVAVNRNSGQVLSTYTFAPFVAKWGDSWEIWAISTCNGEPWAVILGYKQATGPLWAAGNTRTTWDDAEVTCTTGAPYAPIKIPTEGVHTLKQWGRVANERDYYWQTTYTFGLTETNPCWQGAGSNTRPVIVQQEVWLDRGGSVTRGTIVGDPWNGAFSVVYNTRVTAGLGVGTLWTYNPPEGEYCLRSMDLQ